MNSKDTIRVNGKLLLNEVVALNDRLWSSDAETIQIDFAKCDHSSVFDLTFLAHQFRALQKKKSKKIDLINHEHMSWARGMNFFTVSGADWGAEIQANRGDGFNYIPITIVECAPNGQILTQAERSEAIDNQAVHLARVLSHLGSGPVYDAIQYALREIIRNIFEHSGANMFLISGQFYPKHRTVQIIISDTGQGIPNSLRFNSNFKSLGDKDCINLALMPGVSGNERAMRSSGGDIWQNSGDGLYMISRLARNEGLMTIISGQSLIHIHSNDTIRESKENFAISNFAGTLIRVGIRITEEDLAKKLHGWAQEGRDIARDIRGAKQITASAASLLLRRDFDRKKNDTFS
jgi:hypothetical protein